MQFASHISKLQVIYRMWLKFSARAPLLVAVTASGNVTSRKKKARKTDLAPVDFVIYAMFSFTSLVVFTRSEINIRRATRTRRARLLLPAHSFEPGS